MPPTAAAGNKRGGVGFEIKKSLGVFVHEKGTPRREFSDDNDDGKSRVASPRIDVHLSEVPTQKKTI